MKRKGYRPEYLGPLPASLQPDAADASPPVDAEPDLDLDIADGPAMQAPFVSEIAEEVERPLARHAPTNIAGEPHYRPAPPEPKQSATLIYWAATVGAIIVALTPTMFWLGASRRTGPFEFDLFTFSVLGLIGVGLGGLVWMLAFSLRQGNRLANEARYARRQAQEMLQPAMLASAGAGSAIEAVRLEIEHASAAAAQARHELVTLSEVLASETARLVEAAAASSRTANALTASLAGERQGLEQLTTALDAQVVGVNEAIGRQARMVAEASDLAEAQIREAEAVLTARAADLVAAAGETTDATRVASDDLSRQTARLETAGVNVSEQIRAVEENLAEQRAVLVSVSHTLRADQEDFAAQIESQQAQLSEIIVHVRTEAVGLEETTSRTGEAIRELVSQAASQYRQISDAATDERDLLGAAAMQSVGAISEAMRQERAGLEQDTRQAIEAMAAAAEDARSAAAVQAEAARQRIDELGEAAFAAGQKADSVFEARISEAQALIEQSASLVDLAGAKASDRMAASLRSAREAVVELETLLREVDERSQRMPAEAQERSAEVKAIVDQGVDELLTSARKAAEETQAIDAAFQERVRRNYEMLSEAVRLMGVVGGTAAPARPMRSPTAPPAVAEPPRRPLNFKAADAEPAPRDDTATPAEASPEPPRGDHDDADMFEDATASADETPSAEEMGLRPRLKLTPTENDDEVSAVFEPTERDADAAPEGDSEGWSWRDLLSSIDDQPAAADRLGEKMIDEIRALGIDTNALMPGKRIDQIAATLQTGDQVGAREVVRKLAPAAVRRLSRRVLTDIALRSQSDRFLQRYDALIKQAAESDHQGFAVAELLDSDPGRAYLLMDAAAGGLG